MGKPVRKHKEGFSDHVKVAKAKLRVVQKDVAKVAKKMDRKAHQQPWIFVAIAAFVSGFFGLIFGKRRK